MAEELTIAQVSKALGVSARTVRNYMSKGMPSVHRPGPRRGERRFVLEVCKAWVLQNASVKSDSNGRLNQATAKAAAAAAVHNTITVQAPASPSSGDSPTLDQAKIAQVQADTALKRQKLAERSGQLITREVAVRTVEMKLQAVRNALLNLPSRLRSRVPSAPTSLENAVDAEVRSMLHDLNEELEPA